MRIHTESHRTAPPGRKQWLVCAIFIVFLLPGTSGKSQNKVLLVVQDREITQDEFLYHLKRNYQGISEQNISEYLDLFIDFQLKLAQAREERVNQNIGFINELAEYRLLLATPYLTDREKTEELVREASERLQYEVNASHILLKTGTNASPEDTLKIYEKAIRLRNRILDGEPFEKLVLAYSDDPLAPRNSGNMGYFTAFQTEYSFENAVYKLNTGEVSLPVRSNHGYHIIRLNDKRIASNEVKSESEIIDLIRKAEDERTQMIQDAFVAKLKRAWNFEDNPDALEMIYRLADERVYKGNWAGPSDQSFNETLFIIDGKSVYQKDLIEFMEFFETDERNLSVKEYICSLYHKFVAYKLTQYENLKLEEKYPEFRFQYQEYRDAMMLLEITRQKVWLKAESDSTGMDNYYRDHRGKYPSGDEAHDMILADYQEYLMKNWIEKLRSTYKVQINEEALSAIKDRKVCSDSNEEASNSKY